MLQAFFPLLFYTDLYLPPFQIHIFQAVFLAYFPLFRVNSFFW